jgi:hypothetical protein
MLVGGCQCPNPSLPSLRAYISLVGRPASESNQQTSVLRSTSALSLPHLSTPVFLYLPYPLPDTRFVLLVLLVLLNHCYRRPLEIVQLPVDDRSGR